MDEVLAAVIKLYDKRAIIVKTQSIIEYPSDQKSEN